MSRCRLAALALLVGALTISTTFPAIAADDAQKVGADPQQLKQVVDKAIGYLQSKGQAADGSYTAQAGPGITALVTTGLLENGRTVDDPQVAKGLKYLESFVQPTGGIHAKAGMYKNYETSIAMMCFIAANKDKRYDKIIKGADAFLKDLQLSDGGSDAGNPAYGGFGYGRHKRPDLSNTSMALEALRAAGHGPDDEAIKRALLFVSKCQNLETEHNTTKWAPKNPDGGFYYTPAAGGASEAKWPNGESNDVRGLRSYGSMTYAGLKSMIYAGVTKDDPRVKAATDWIRKNYSIDENPGLGNQGLFYYYNTFAKALNALGEDQVTDAKGVKHDWRRELVEKFASLQKPDGSFMNSADRWMEGDPNLVTGYALLALANCQPKTP